jgi:hypothetical protein
MVDAPRIRIASSPRSRCQRDHKIFSTDGAVSDVEPSVSSA